MAMNDSSLDLENMLNDLPAGDDAAGAVASEPAQQQRRRAMSQMMRKIPVTMTLEVGSARLTLQELMDIGPDSVVALDVLVGEALTIKVNGTAIGRAEVVVAGENYGLKVLELDGLDLDALNP